MLKICFLNRHYKKVKTDDFMLGLKWKSQFCNVGGLAKTQIEGQIEAWIWNKILRKMFFKNPEVTGGKTIRI